MDFNDAPAQATLRSQVRTWLGENAELRSVVSADRAEDPADIERGRAWQRRKHDSGWAGLTWPEAYGGRGLGAIDQVVWDQEAAAFDVPEETFVGSNMIAGPTIIDVGRPDQQAEHLPAILDGRSIWCQLFSEPDAGSDLAGLKTRAFLDGDSWVVTGQKVWSSGAHYADWGLLLARTGSHKHAGITCFILDMRTAGLDIRRIKQITGESHFNEVFLDGVRIPADATLGVPGDGWSVALRTLNHERLGLTFRRRVDVAAFVDLVREVPVGDRPAAAHPDIRQDVADIWMRAEAINLLGYRTLTKMARGQSPGSESSIGKLAGADLINRVGRMAVELVGAEGVWDRPDLATKWHHAFLDATARRIAGGSDEVQRNIIGEKILGLPREVRIAPAEGVGHAN